MRRLLTIAAVWSSLTGVIYAEEGFVPPEHPPVTAELVAQHASIRPLGSTKLGVLFEIEPGWHIYAEQPGDAGLPTKVTWKVRAAMSFEPLVWPEPQKFLDPGDIVTYGYAGTVILFSPITYTPLLNPDHRYPDLDIHAHVEWLACREICIPGKTDLTLMLPVREQEPAYSTHAQLFELTD